MKYESIYKRFHTTLLIQNHKTINIYIYIYIMDYPFLLSLTIMNV